MERNKEMYQLYKEGKMTLEKIGNIYGITRERVRQIISSQPGYTKNIYKLPPETFNCRWCKIKVERNKRGSGFCSRKCYYAFSDNYQKSVLIKKCRDCKIIKPIGQFYPNYRVLFNGKESVATLPYCKGCQLERNEKWAKENPILRKIIGRKSANKYYRNHRREILAAQKEARRSSHLPRN